MLALEAKFKDQPWVRLWIDIFCHNQHDELTSDEWITKFEQHIVRIHNTVMIVFPWRNPIPFTRLLPSTTTTTATTTTTFTTTTTTTTTAAATTTTPHVTMT